MKLFAIAGVLLLSMVLTSCYTYNEFADHNKKTEAILKSVIQKADTISKSNALVQNEYVTEGSGSNIQMYIDSIRKISEVYLADMPLLTSKKIRVKHHSYVKKRTAFIQHEAASSERHLQITAEMVSTIYALSHVPATDPKTGAVLKETLQKIEGINTATDKKLKDGTLDNSSATAIKTYTDTIREQTIRHMKEDSIINATPGKHKHVNDITAQVKRLAAAAQKNLDDIKVVDELLKTNTFTFVNSGDLFGPGKFEFTEERLPLVMQTFSPTVNNILNFLRKFPGKQLEVYIVSLGYSDAGNIQSTSILGKTLLDSLKTTTANRSLLNKELSRLRAQSVVRFFDNRFQAAAVPGVKYGYIPQGRGEELPDNSITNYKVSDTRRRVVKIYWTVLPFSND